MGAIHDEKAYAIKLRESANDGSDFSNPEADYRMVFLGEDGELHKRDSAGAVTGFSGGTPAAHAASHENGGSDEIDVTGLVGAGGGGSEPYLDTITLDATYGDEFTGATLDAKWTRRNLVDGDDVEQDGGGSWLTANLPGSTMSVGYLQTHPNTDMTIVAAYSIVPGNDQFIGPCIIDSAGDGWTAVFYQSDFLLAGLTAYAYNASAPSIPLSNGAYAPARAGMKVWVEMMRVGNNCKGRFSLNGYTWSHYTANLAATKTIDRIGFLRSVNQAAGTLSIDRFNKTA